ncbi:YbhB/YbcL family Raf kinase inhibitor-like protein [Pseudobacteriovorax antillogorgiicola]|uniref:Phospholipid-binding protein, PBP family n=1 Tax=Pseudobacteriovorax antillogorgiicola TaxID=1513793 RepID=A0A1Y6C7Q2_9BACT|nr:YbhB/YbcL family Raf kinase inhibitor-like protein [Pseudobacteriovorax antillogorgiicola]TCS50760.1 PBP family phospholipid-binding protein [Pseudobacteriovorax antillogorgiicola]SMF41186.1 phospholipid-binding protein, PBP family [Pseudobacteriovorax antillogorgiicola]
MKILSILAMLSICTTGKSINVTTKGTKGSYLQHRHTYDGFGCTGLNQVPDISWSELPQDAKYVSITIYDPDAPTGGGWWHWAISNIPVDTFKRINNDNYKKVVAAGAVESLTSFGQPGYGGPCPPKEDHPHRYVVSVYALKDKIKVESSYQPALVGFILNSNKLAMTTTTLLYGR